MAFVPGCEWDVFISYAHIDNEPVWGTRWVTDLVDRLDPLLRQRLGDAETLRVFRDGAQIQSNAELPQLLSNVRQSALFVAIGSPNYVTRPWTLDEVRTFRQLTGDSSRLFSIEYLPPPPGSYPPELGQKIQQWFWEYSGERKKASAITLQSNPGLYREKLEALADDIAQKLLELRAAAGHAPARTHTLSVARRQAAANGSRPDTRQPDGRQPDAKRLRKVLLAKTVGALEEELEGLRDALCQYDDEVTVVSAGDYFETGLEFCATFLNDLDSADLFVQLLGKAPARTPPELPEGYTRFQLREAIERSVPVLQWRPTDLNLNAIEDKDYLLMLKAETVQASGIQALQKQILEIARKEPTPPPDPSRGTVVFINAHATDRAVAERLKLEFRGKPVEIRFPAALLAGEASMSAEDMSADLAENLTGSDVLVFIYSKATHKWIRAQLLSLSKSRGVKTDEARRNKMLEVVYIGPPPDNPDPGIYPPNVQMIACPPDGDLEPLMKLIRQAVP